MKYICLGFMDESVWENMSEKDRNIFVDTCFNYDDELRKNGHYTGGEALQGPESATSLRYHNDKVQLTDGPFTETKEYLGGIMILEAADLNEAIRLMSKHPSLRLGKGGGGWEIRPAADLNLMMNDSIERRSEGNGDSK